MPDIQGDTQSEGFNKNGNWRVSIVLSAPHLVSPFVLLWWRDCKRAADDMIFYLVIHCKFC